MAFMNTVWGPVDGSFEYDVGTSGWLCLDVKIQMWRHYFPNVLCMVYF